MKKFGLIVVVGAIFILSSCEYRTCPTYTRKPTKIEKLEKLDREENNAAIKINV